MSASDMAKVDSLLVLVLTGLVPMHIAKLRAERKGGLLTGEDIAQVVEEITSSADLVIRGHGDRRQSATALSAIAHGIAILCLADPAGFTLFGHHWCADHSQHAGHLACEVAG